MIKYSVVIPTRDRFEYLNSAIESCLVSIRDDIEVVVSINGTKTWPEVLETYQPIEDPRLRYVLTDQLLPMQQSFNFGILQARGKYVTTLGDDDALLPSAFAYADYFFDQYPEVPLCWFRRPYFWPDYEQQPASNERANTLHYFRITSLNLIQSKPVLEACCNGYFPYQSLPSIYNSFYPAWLIHRLRAAQEELEGKDSCRSIFLKQTLSVDVFTAYASLIFVDLFAIISIPLSLSGISSRSNGMAALKRGFGEEAKKFLSELRSHQLQAIRTGPFNSYHVSSVQAYNDACNAILAYSQCAGIVLPALDCRAIAGGLIEAYMNEEFTSQPWTIFEIIRLAMDYDCRDSLSRLQKLAAWYIDEYDCAIKNWWVCQAPDFPLVQQRSEEIVVLNCGKLQVRKASQAATLYQDLLDGRTKILDDSNQPSNSSP